MEEKFEKKINSEDYVNVGDCLNFDNFYISAFNLILSDIKKKDFDTSDLYKNFFENICKPIYGNYNNNETNKLFKLIQFIFNPEKFREIKKKYEINQMNIESLLYGYRYCLNEIAEKNKGGEYIFSSLYNGDNIGCLKEKFYSCSDTSNESYYELYNKIENHFKKTPKEGCYICLCDKNKGYYHKIPSGFPGYEDEGKCPICDCSIGAKVIYIKDNENNENNYLSQVCEPIKRENYFRIFNDKKEVEDTDSNYLSKINYMTKDEFKQKYIIPLSINEKKIK